MEKRGKEHNKAQIEGKKRDLYTCQVCGCKEHVQGHHIIDYQYGGKASSDNIITLCTDCHKKAHNGKITISKF